MELVPPDNSRGSGVGYAWAVVLAVAVTVLQRVVPTAQEAWPVLLVPLDVPHSTAAHLLEYPDVQVLALSLELPPRSMERLKGRGTLL